MHLHHQKLIYSVQMEFSERAKHRGEGWMDVQRSNEEMKEEEWTENSTMIKKREKAGMICLISKTTPMTEPFFISQQYLTVFINAGVTRQPQRSVILSYPYGMHGIEQYNAGIAEHPCCVCVNDIIQITGVKQILRWTVMEINVASTCRKAIHHMHGTQYYRICQKYRQVYIS